MGGEPRLLLIQVDGNDVEMDRRTAADRQQDLQEPVTVFPAGKADHDLVAFLDHAVVGNGLSHQAAEAGVHAFDLVGVPGRLCGAWGWWGGCALHGPAL